MGLGVEEELYILFLSLCFSGLVPWGICHMFSTLGTPSHLLPSETMSPGKPLYFSCFWMHSLPAMGKLPHILGVYNRIINTEKVTVQDHSACGWSFHSTWAVGFFLLPCSLVRDSSEVQHPKCPISQEIHFCLNCCVYVCACCIHVTVQMWRPNGHVQVRAGCWGSPSAFPIAQRWCLSLNWKFIV